MAEIWAAAVVAGGAIIGGAASAYGASEQAGAAENAQNISENQYQNTLDLENPYNQAGYSALNALDQGLGLNYQANGAGAGTVGTGSLTAPFTASDFQSLSPAYQFQLSQGQQGVLNADSSAEGALSGAAQKDLIGYSQNFANTSFNNAFNQYQTQQGNIYSRLSNIANLGQSAASGTAQAGTALAGQAAQSATNVGTAYANGASGVANSLNSGASNALLASYLNNGGSPSASYGSGGAATTGVSGVNYDGSGN